MKAAIHAVMVAALAALLAACGGGGGDPGQCISGSPENCAENR